MDKTQDWTVTLYQIEEKSWIDMCALIGADIDCRVADCDVKQAMFLSGVLRLVFGNCHFLCYSTWEKKMGFWIGAGLSVDLNLKGAIQAVTGLRCNFIV